MSENDSLSENFTSDWVSQIQWRLGLWLTLAILATGILMTLLLASGLANPPRAGSQRWQAAAIHDWRLLPYPNNLILYSAPLNISEKPFTLEVTAVNTGQPDSAWGIWLNVSAHCCLALVNNQGYYSIDRTPMVSWTEFLHIRPQAENKLYLHVETDNSVTLRINDEIAWTETLDIPPKLNWGVAFYRDPHITWESIELYTR